MPFLWHVRIVSQKFDARCPKKDYFWFHLDPNACVSVSVSACMYKYKHKLVSTCKLSDDTSESTFILYIDKQSHNFGHTLMFGRAWWQSLRTYFLCTKVSISNELTSKVSNICTCLRMKCQAKHMLALCTYCFLRCHHWNQNAPDFQVHGAETKEAC